MNTTIVTFFCFLALVLGGCAGSPKTKPVATDMNAQYRVLVEKDKIGALIDSNLIRNTLMAIRIWRPVNKRTGINL